MNADLVENFSKKNYVGQDDNPDSIRFASEVPFQYTTELRKYLSDSKQPVEGGPWLSKTEVPTSDEIIGRLDTESIINLTPTLQPNKIEGSYESAEEYLSIHYELIREDAIRPLREAVGKVRGSPFEMEAAYSNNGNNSVGIYEPVHIKSVICSPRGLAVRVAFSLSRVGKKIRWDQSKRLIAGSLVALSPKEDAFRTTCILATVAARPVAAVEQNPPEIDLFFARPEEVELDPAIPFMMVEDRSSFYEASRHTLAALQKLMRESFPLSEHLVECQPVVEAPKYVRQKPHTDLSSIVALEDGPAYENINILEEWPNTKTTGLDHSQSAALQRILTKRLAIVQGPPGTGKTYVSVVALKALLSNMKPGDPPIIVTCQTNHALDQILRHIAQFEPLFVRLGGQSKDMDIVKKRTLHEVRQDFSQPLMPRGVKGPAMKSQKELTKNMQMLLAPLESNQDRLLTHELLFRLGLITEEQADSLEYLRMQGQNPMDLWLGEAIVPAHQAIEPDDFGFDIEEVDLEFEQLKELEAETLAKDDEDFETLKGTTILLSDNFTGKITTPLTDDQVQRQLQKKDFFEIQRKYRGTVYRYLQRAVKRIIVKDFRQLAKKYDECTIQRRIGQWEQDNLLLQGQKIIGMTTTGLSKYRALVASLNPKIVLVEEAAETLEAPVIAACVPSLEHLILVGDHKQLRPNCQRKEHQDEPYYLNVSLFERLVINGIEFETLRSQRRMIPEIRRLLKPIYGEALVDQPTVLDIENRSPIEGMGGCNSWFFTHEWPESQDQNMSSINLNEAKMIVGFFDYLVYNGIPTDNITVLTFYNGQRKAILKGLRGHPNLKGQTYFKVVTVDSYQGEENDIVLLSLVRSNKRFKIGFLNVENRLCVALSRAKRGFYIFGNGELMCGESGLWSNVIEMMYGKKGEKPMMGPSRRVGYRLPLQCKNHGRKTFIEDPSDWELLNGGCDKKCQCTLPCGHTCMLRCHPFSRSRINCVQKCMKIVESCGHRCDGVCCDPCRCETCSRANTSGMRPVIKSATAQDVVPLEKQPTPTMSSNTSRSDQKAWKDYADKGVLEDDAAYYKRAQSLSRQNPDHYPGQSDGVLQDKAQNDTYTPAVVPPSTQTVVGPSTPPPGGVKVLKVCPFENGGPKTPPKPNPNLLIDFSDNSSPAYSSESGRYIFKEQFTPTQSVPRQKKIDMSRQNLLD